jgi:NAD+ synthase (glutamine-hydrolysing)
MPKYRMFDDERHFYSLQKLAQEEGRKLEDYYKPFEVTIDGIRKKISLLICEDIWNINNDYNIDPVQIVKKKSPDLIAVSSASPF